ncbi:choice-of-anchor M domain-containing protein, partial [Actinotignum timonense]|uniref:choice-of-anchor M domain-containing protein n=1 Tax=Actinotignum timonense TaxID=1870995 RepID=UPI002A824C3F
PSAAPGSTSGSGSSTAVDPALTQTVSGDEQLAPAGTPVEISSGHVDMGPRLTDAGWDFLVRDDSGAAPVWRSMDDVVFRVGEAARMEVPATDAYSFIHASGPAYVIPQQQLADVPWLGWNTQDPGVVSRVNGDVALTYGGHAGEGQFTAFVDSGNFSGPTLLWNSEVATSQPVHVSLNTHTHANWVFTQPGTYTVGLALNATATDGTRLSSTTTLTFNVGGSGTANSGHYDLGAVVDGGQLRAAVKDDNSGQWVDPASLSFGLGEAAATTAPAGIDFVASAGERIYMISSSQVSGVPWLGANTQHPSFREATTGELTLSVTSVSGPGKMAVFESGTFGQLVGQQWFGSSGGGTETVWEGRTADGQPCELSAEQIAQLEREGKKLGNNLAHSGSEVIDPLSVTLALLCVGGVVLYTRKRA